MEQAQNVLSLSERWYVDPKTGTTLTGVAYIHLNTEDGNLVPTGIPVSPSQLLESEDDSTGCSQAASPERRSARKPTGRPRKRVAEALNTTGRGRASTRKLRETGSNRAPARASGPRAAKQTKKRSRSISPESEADSSPASTTSRTRAKRTVKAVERRSTLATEKARSNTFAVPLIGSMETAIRRVVEDVTEGPIPDDDVNTTELEKGAWVRRSQRAPKPKQPPSHFSSEPRKRKASGTSVIPKLPVIRNSVNGHIPSVPPPRHDGPNARIWHASAPVSVSSLPASITTNVVSPASPNPPPRHDGPNARVWHAGRLPSVIAPLAPPTPPTLPAAIVIGHVSPTPPPRHDGPNARVWHVSPPSSVPSSPASPRTPSTFPSVRLILRQPQTPPRRIDRTRRVTVEWNQAAYDEFELNGLWYGRFVAEHLKLTSPPVRLAALLWYNEVRALFPELKNEHAMLVETVDLTKTTAEQTHDAMKLLGVGNRHRADAVQSAEFQRLRERGKVEFGLYADYAEASNESSPTDIVRAAICSSTAPPVMDDSVEERCSLLGPLQDPDAALVLVSQLGADNGIPEVV
ncbi:hypothetical protein HKX48_008347 [Thoreauomyces humboldtii]|nr:hypothetical protein HKX48_008347 [Thoreauomyces humboldtii]